MRTDENSKEKAKKKDMYHFMKQFRETFCRPIDPLRFIGLFDCVNSVPQFESAWMSRTKFPYTARSSARVIRHAVSIDERRAKFRQDLISAKRTVPADHGHIDEHGHFHLHHRQAAKKEVNGTNGVNGKHPEEDAPPPLLHRSSTMESGRFRTKSRHRPHLTTMREAELSIHDGASGVSFDSAQGIRRAEDSSVVPLTNDEQDILEVWFAGT